MIKLRLLPAWLFLLLPLQLTAAEIRVAVASNFTQAMDAIVEQFEAKSHHQVDLIYASTGKIYAQIINGAPFDAFFAADVERPTLLEEENKIQPGSRFSYAFGQIVLWSPDNNLVDKQGEVLASDQFRHLAIANPRLAPYGLAAQQILEAKGLWQQLQARMVRGENISQTFHFVNSGNAELGFVALSQLQTLSPDQHGSQWLVPAPLYEAIEQQAVQLTDKSAVTELMTFVKSEAGKKIIQQFGYNTP